MLFPMPEDIRQIFHPRRLRSHIGPPVRFRPVDRYGRQRCVFCGLCLSESTGRCPRVVRGPDGMWEHPNK